MHLVFDNPVTTVACLAPKDAIVFLPLFDGQIDRAYELLFAKDAETVTLENAVVEVVMAVSIDVLLTNDCASDIADTFADEAARFSNDSNVVLRKYLVETFSDQWGDLVEVFASSGADEGKATS